MKSRLYDSAPLIVFALLCAAAGEMAFKTFSMDLGFGFALLWSVPIVLALYFLLINKKITVIVFAVTVITALIIYLRLEEEAREVIFDFFGKSVAFFISGGKLGEVYTRILGVIMLFVFCLVLILPALIFPFFPALFAICMTFVLMQWGQNNTVMLTEASIIFGALIVFFARSMKIRESEPTKKVRNISAIWLAPFAAIIMLSVAGIAKNDELDKKWEWLEVRTNIISDYFADVAGSSAPRTVFDISKMGYQPLGGRLGGPVELDDTEIMKVRAQYPLLLRGSIKNTYTGYSWVDDTVSYRSRLISKFRNDQWDVFNLGLPAEEVKDNFYFEDIKTYIYPSTDSSATIFAPIRMTDVKPDKVLTMLVSFNTEGEVFSSRDIGAGISYTVESEHLKYDSPSFDAYVVEVQQSLAAGEPAYDELFELNYMSEFESVPQSVNALTNEITSDLSSDYLKAEAIKRYLEDGFIYTLNPGIPPEGNDFVEYFLETREGYCTYFASAMAVMARSAGLPSRYIEGFKIPEGSPSAMRSVTGENAHAWAEIYIRGFGWMPFEPQTSEGEASVSEPLIEEPFEEIFDESTPEPEMPLEPIEEKSRSFLPYIIVSGIILAFVLAAALLIALSKMRAGLLFIKNRAGATNEAVIFYYKEIMAILAYLNYAKPLGHTLNTYAQGVDKKIVMTGCLFKNVASAVSKIVYAKEKLPEEYIKSVHAYYWSLLRFIKVRLGIFRYFVILIKLLFTASLRKNGLPS